MKILLLGEYSNLHATLAEGLRKLGHEVLVVSDGTYIYDYKRDISLSRKGKGAWSAFKYMCKLLVTLPRLKGFDVVQLINPDCFALKAERQFALSAGYSATAISMSVTIFVPTLIPSRSSKSGFTRQRVSSAATSPPTAMPSLLVSTNTS